MQNPFLCAAPSKWAIFPNGNCQWSDGDDGFARRNSRSESSVSPGICTLRTCGALCTVSATGDLPFWRKLAVVESHPETSTRISSHQGVKLPCRSPICNVNEDGVTSHANSIRRKLPRL